jgi:FkbM family methyltransferase
MDLGANIGMFSMLAARAHAGARIFSYEPGPPNIRVNRMNMLANPEIAGRIELMEAAVAGCSGEAHWHFDPENPGGSFLATNGKAMPGHLLQVRLVAFAEAVASFPGEIALVKMDIEGSEWDVLAATPKETWDRIQAIALELHDDATGRQTRKNFLDRLAAYGFKIEHESVITYFLHR